MKRLFSLSLLAASVLLLSSCDEIEQPVITTPNPYNAVKYGDAPTFTPVASPIKNVFIEEFTGHLCGFCPPATAMVKALDEELGERLVPLSVHAGTLAVVSNPPFETDYNTEIGNIYWGQLEGGFNPAARIDRQGGISNFYVENAWEANINTQLAETPSTMLQIQAEAIDADGVVNIHVHNQFLQNLSGSYNLIVLLAESHIISAQEDYDQTPSEILDYEHNHLLRTGATGAYGVPLATNPTSNLESVNSFTLPVQSNWNTSNCTVIAFVIDNTTQEVLNACEFELD